MNYLPLFGGKLGFVAVAHAIQAVLQIPVGIHVLGDQLLLRRKTLAVAVRVTVQMRLGRPAED